jgi:hypothetical protein
LERGLGFQGALRQYYRRTLLEKITKVGTNLSMRFSYSQTIASIPFCLPKQEALGEYFQRDGFIAIDDNCDWYS